jgi:predicted nucleic acid-binding protein
MIAVDTGVLVDLLAGQRRADAALESLRAAMQRGPVVVCEVVVSEIVASFGQSAELVDTLEEMGLGFSPLEMRAAVRAGEMQRRYHERVHERLHAAEQRPTQLRAGADFLIGAHALLQCQGLITHDAGFFRDYFKGLKVIVPKA